MNQPAILARITKIDEEKRLVYMRIAEEAPDKVREIFDYAGSKPYFEQWSKNQFEASGGKSYGNVRAMHGKIAAGILVEPLVFNDAAKTIDVVSKATDDQEWRKCLDGTYTGASIGGAYVGERKTEKWTDGGEVLRYVANPAEVSYVDSPCMPGAKFFEVIKADGKVEKVAFKPAPLEVTGSDEDVAKFAEALNAAGLTIADAIKLVEVEAAARVEKAAIDADDELIKTALSKPLIESDSDEARDKNVAAEIKAGKSPEQAAAIAYAIQRKHKRKAKAEEPQMQKDIAEMFAYADLKKLLDDPKLTLGALLKLASDNDVVVEDMDILLDQASEGLDPVSKMKKAILAKKMTSANKDRIQAIHDHASSMGADCDGDTDKRAKGDLQKASDTASQLSAALKRIEALEKQPMPHVITLQTVRKSLVGEVSSEEKKDALMAMGYDKLDKFADGTIDWKRSERLLEQSGAAA